MEKDSVVTAASIYARHAEGLPRLRRISTALFNVMVALLLGSVLGHQQFKPVLLFFGGMALNLLSAIFCIVLLDVASDTDNLPSSRRLRIFDTTKYIARYMAILGACFLAVGLLHLDYGRVVAGLQTMWSIVSESLCGFLQ